MLLMTTNWFEFWSSEHRRFASISLTREQPAGYTFTWSSSVADNRAALISFLMQGCHCVLALMSQFYVLGEWFDSPTWGRSGLFRVLLKTFIPSTFPSLPLGLGDSLRGRGGAWDAEYTHRRLRSWLLAAAVTASLLHQLCPCCPTCPISYYKNEATIIHSG